MASDRPNRRVILALACALGGALLVIAFLVGRLTGGDLARDPVLDPVPDRVPDRVPARVPDPDPDLVPDRGSEASGFVQADGARAGAVQIQRMPDGRIVLSNTESTGSNAAASPQPEATGAQSAEPSAVRDYLLRMNQIQSASGAGDPNTFAMGLIKAGLGGATSGFDRLIDDTLRMETEIKSLTPPAACQRYHEASLEGVLESRAMLEDLKGAVVAKDIAKLSEVAREASVLQTKANALKAMEREIRAGL